MLHVKKWKKKNTLRTFRQRGQGRCSCKTTNISIAEPFWRPEQTAVGFRCLQMHWLCQFCKYDVYWVDKNVTKFSIIVLQLQVLLYVINKIILYICTNLLNCIYQGSWQIKLIFYQSSLSQVSCWHFRTFDYAHCIVAPGLQYIVHVDSLPMRNKRNVL